VVLIGPDHNQAGRSFISLSVADWSTPYGLLEPDISAINGLAHVASIDEDALAGEESISGLAAFIKRSQSQAKFLPIIINERTSTEDCGRLAEALFHQVASKKTLMLASVDFSHYLPAAAAEFHDIKSRAVISAFELNRIYGLETDSAPALYTLLRYLQLSGAQTSELVYKTNSGILSGRADDPTTSHNFYYFHKGNPAPYYALNMLFFGDVMIDRHVKERIDKKGADWLFSVLAGKEDRFFKGVDIIGANLEGAVTAAGAHYPPENGNDFAFSPTPVRAFNDYGFNFFNLANNHLTDQGERGIIETRKNLSDLKFNFSGNRDGTADDMSATTTIISGYRLGLVGFSMVYNEPELAAMERVVSELASTTDLVILNMHWGVEYDHYANNIQKELAHRLIDAGADIVIGHHPHVVQGVEIYESRRAATNGAHANEIIRRPIFYSLGNFIFDQYFSADTQEGLALGINWQPDKMEVFLFSLRSVMSQVRLMGEEEKNDFFDKLINWSDDDNVFQRQIREGKLLISLY
jgi:hypothetical protein